MEFEIVDRRGENKAAEAVPAAVSEEPVMATGSHAVVEFKKTVRGEVQHFKSVGYTIVQIGINGQGMLAVRAVGLRTDEKVFMADWMLPPVLQEDEVPQAEAKKRLMTFKSCSCGEQGRCAFHGEVCPGPAGAGRWIEEDLKRLKKVAETPLCEALEVVMRAEMARQQQRIVVPGRG